METSFILRRAIQAILPATLLLAACGKSDTPAPAAPDQGRIQLVQAAPYNQVKIDLYANDSKLGDSEYGRPSGYFNINAGSQSIRVKTSSNSTDVFPAFSQIIEKDKRYTVYAYNSTANAVGYLTTIDEQTAPAANKANVRFVNLGFDANNVTLTYTGSGATPIATNIAYGTASTYTSVDARLYSLQVRDMTIQGNTLTTKDFTFENGRVYTVLLRGRNSSSVPPADQLMLQVIPNN